MGTFFNLFHPERFQGEGKKKRYFEGWYFKVTDVSEKHPYAIIPGVAMDTDGNRHAFIQVFNGSQRHNSYHKFAFDQFLFTPDDFVVTIGNNHFSAQAISLALPELCGTLHFSEIVRWPKHWYSPGIMGPFTFLPFMECYHGVVSMNHRIQGKLETAAGQFDFTDGRGYIEKDWGSSFPSAYTWMQSNHFSEPDISLMLSIAKIPVLGTSFTGCIGALWLKKRLYRFATYTGTKIQELKITEAAVSVVLEDRCCRLEIFAQRDFATSLASPIGGLMEGRIEESLSATITVRLMDVRHKQTLFHDTGRLAGLEVAGAIPELMR